MHKKGFIVPFSCVYIVSFDDIHPTTLSCASPLLSIIFLFPPGPHAPPSTLPFFFHGFVYRPESLMNVWSNKSLKARHLFTQQPMNCQ